MNKLTIFIIGVLVLGGFLYFSSDKPGFNTENNLVNTPVDNQVGNQVGNIEEENPATPTPVSQPTPSPSGSPSIPPTPKPTPTPTTTPVTGSATVVSKVSTTSKVVVLTFDAGADRGFAAKILDTLRDEKVNASFGMTGKWAEQNPDIIRRIVNEGHDFINHTYSHGSFTGFSTNKAPLTQTERSEELDRTERIIMSLVGRSTKPYFRPPYGDYNASVNRDIYARGYRFNIMWTVDSLGWKGLSAEEIRQRVVSGTVPGAIHLFHVGEQSQDAAALPLIISDLRARGYTFAKISDLVK